MARIDHVLVATAKSRYSRTLTSETVNDSYLICGRLHGLYERGLIYDFTARQYPAKIVAVDPPEKCCIA